MAEPFVRPGTFPIGLILNSKRNTIAHITNCWDLLEEKDGKKEAIYIFEQISIYCTPNYFVIAYIAQPKQSNDEKEISARRSFDSMDVELKSAYVRLEAKDGKKAVVKYLLSYSTSLRIPIINDFLLSFFK